MVLRRTEKNELLELVARSRLRSNEFTLDQNDYATRIYHPSSVSMLKIYEKSATGILVTVKIGNSQRQGLADTWADVKLAFGQWLDDVRVEINTPDLWEELRRGSTLISEAVGPDRSNAPFTPSEQQQISAQLKEIRVQVTELCSLTAEQSAEMNERFDLTEEASRRLGRKDWILLFGGALLSLVASVVVPPEVLQHVLTMAADRLGHLFDGGPPQLPPQAHS